MEIRVITKLPNSEQSYKGKVKTHKYIDRQKEPILQNQCIDGMIETKWVSGDFIPQKLADVLVEENIAGLTESDDSDDEYDDVLFSLIDGEEED